VHPAGQGGAPSSRPGEGPRWISCPAPPTSVKLCPLTTAVCLQAPAAACDNAAHAPPVPQSPAVAAPAAAQAQLAAAEPAAADGLAQPVQQAAAAALGVDASPPQPLMPPWDQENATARNLGKFQGQLKVCCCIGPSSALLLLSPAAVIQLVAASTATFCATNTNPSCTQGSWLMLVG
jgi:hypothetical protein